MDITSYIAADLQRIGVRSVVYTKEGDNATRFVHIALFDGSQPYSVPSYADVAAVVCFAKSDGTSGVYDQIGDGDDAHAAYIWDNDGRGLTVELAPAITDGYGLVACEVRLVSGTQTLSTWTFDIIVQKSVTSGTRGEDYFSFSALEKLQQIVSRLNIITGSLLYHVEKSYQWEHGFINSAGTETVQGNSIRTADYIPVPELVSITPDPGSKYVFKIYKTGNVIIYSSPAWLTTPTVLADWLADNPAIASEAESVRICARYDPEQSVPDTPAAISALAQKIHTVASMSKLLIMERSPRYLTPEMFGAVGDGQSDDTAPLQRCLNEAAQSGSVVRLDGSYYITARVTATGITAMGGGTIKIKSVNAAASADIKTYLRFIGCTVDGITIESSNDYSSPWLSLDPPYNVPTSLYSNVVVDAMDSVFRYCGFRALEKVMVINDNVLGRSNSMLFDGCIWRDCAQCVTGSGHNTVITNCDLGGLPYTGNLAHCLYCANGVDGLIVRDSIFRDCKNYPIHIYDTAAGVKPKNALVQGCVVHGCENVLATNAEHLTVDGLRADCPGEYAIYLDTNSRLDMSNCVIGGNVLIRGVSHSADTVMDVSVNIRDCDLNVKRIMYDTNVNHVNRIRSRNTVYHYNGTNSVFYNTQAMADITFEHDLFEYAGYTSNFITVSRDSPDVSIKAIGCAFEMDGYVFNRTADVKTGKIVMINNVIVGSAQKVRYGTADTDINNNTI